MCIGDKIQIIINKVTFGFGKAFASKIANFLGFEDCGCSKRQQWLNTKFGCKKNISLK